jgi:hypothetical protein
MKIRSLHYLLFWYCPFKLYAKWWVKYKFQPMMRELERKYWWTMISYAYYCEGGIGSPSMVVIWIGNYPLRYSYLVMPALNHLD